MKYIAHEQIGYFARDKVVTVDKKLASMPYAQCGVRINENEVIDFYSYSSLVFRCIPIESTDPSDFGTEDIWTFSDIPKDTPNTYAIYTGFDALPNYSQTTIRQCDAFLREYFSIRYIDWKHVYKISGEPACILAVRN